MEKCVRSTKKNNNFEFTFNLICMKKDDNTEWPYRAHSLIPWYYPSLDYEGIVIGYDNFDIYKNIMDIDYACRSPINLDASISYKHDLNNFISINKRIKDQCENGDCSICLDSFINPEDQHILVNICQNGHIFHKECVYKKKLAKCPLCNCNVTYQN